MIPGILTIVSAVIVSLWFIRFTISPASHIPVDRTPPVPEIVVDIAVYSTPSANYVGYV